MGSDFDDRNARRLEPDLDVVTGHPFYFEPNLSFQIGERLDHPHSWSIDVVRRMEWKRFEILAAAYYRHLGFRVETVDHGPDGGIDATLYEGDAVTPYAILQCKAWDQRVDVKPIRELLGVMTHREVRRGFFLTRSDFT